jgi:hypothetical protein
VELLARHEALLQHEVVDPLAGAQRFLRAISVERAYPV